MDRRTVISRTGKGLMEATGKTSILSRDLRNILKEVDGTLTVAKLAEKVGKGDDKSLIEALGKLMKDGFVREVIPQQEEAPVSRAPLSRAPATKAPAQDSGADLDFTAMPSKPAARADEDARLQAQAEEIARQAQATRAREEAAARAKAEAEARAKAEAAAKAKAEAEAKAKAEAAARARAEAEAKAKAEAAARARMEAEAKAKAEAEAKARSAAAAELNQVLAKEREQKEADTRARKESEERARREAEEKARREAEERARKEAEERARREAEEKARREAEEKARREAEVRARRETEEKARREAEERARREAEEKARREAEERARKEAEERARREAEERAKKEAEDKARREREEREHAERLARIEAEARAKVEAESRAKREAEERARREAEAKAAREAEEKAKKEAEEKTRREAEERARKEAEERSRREAEERAQKEAAEKARREKEDQERREREERERREAEERARREAEEKERAEQEARRREEEERAREAEKKDKEQAKARAKAEAEEAALARKAARERERAEADARNAAEAAQREKESARAAMPGEPRALRRRRSLARPVALVVFVLLAGAMAALTFRSIDPGLYEKAAEEWLGQPVKIGAVHLSLVPAPALRFDRVAIGTEPQLRIASVKAAPAMGALFGEQRSLKSIEFDGAVVPREFLGALLFGKGRGNTLEIERISAKGVKLDIPGLALPALEASALLGADGSLRSVALANGELKLSAKVEPREGKLAVEISADSMPLPIGGDLALRDFSAKGSASATELTLTEIEAKAFDGYLQGNARMRWSGGWRLEGGFTVRQMEAAKLAAPLLASGKLEGKGQYTMSAQSADKLFGSARLEGEFTVQKGNIGNVDMAQALQGGGASGGITLFSELGGSVLAEGGRVQARQLRMVAGLMSASGSVDVDAQKNLAGRLQVELRSQATQARATLAVSGTLNDPQFRRGN